MRGETYLFSAALLFTAGNLSAAYICAGASSPDTAAGLTVLACTVLLLAALTAGRRSCMAYLLAFPALGAAGSAIHTALRPGIESSALREADRLAISGIITDGGISSSGRPFLKIETESENTIIYNIPAGTDWRPGDTVTAVVRCTRVRNFSDGFDYRLYMEERGIFYTCLFSNDCRMVIRKCSRPPVRLLPARMRQRFSAAVDRAMPSEETAVTRAVIKALAYGYQDEIPDEIEESFRQSGAIHLLALSGMHLGLLYGLLSGLLSVAGGSAAAKKLKSVIIMAILWAFTIFTGCGVSILRAAVMFTIYEAGILAGRKRCGVSSLAMSALIITSVDPAAPSGLSFQLSYAAMTAIFLIYPHLRDIVPAGNRIARQFRDVCAMTVACQITTAPIIFLHFGTFAFFSLTANLLCSPLVSAAMLLIPAAMLLPGLTGQAAERLLSLTIEIFIRINTTISEL